MEDNEKIDVDMEGVADQQESEIYEKGEYVKIEILAQTANDFDELKQTFPLCKVTVHNSNPLTIGLIARALEDTAKHILKTYDAQDSYDLINLLSKKSGTIEIRGKDDKSE